LRGFITGVGEAQSTFGSIVGAVKDPSDLLVPDAKITLLNLDDQSVRTSTSDANGAFQFLNAKAGHYEVNVQAAGFAPFKIQNVQLDARQTLRVDVRGVMEL
jgi:hypothetical protein